MLSIFDPGSIFERRPSVKDTMDCVLSPDDIDNLPQSSSLVSCSGVSAINAHEITIITGTESARTALFAKMIAATVIGGTDYPFASGMTSQLKNGKVLWVDAVNSMQATAQLMRDMKTHFNASKENFRVIALTALGFDQNYSSIVKQVLNQTMLDFNPNLVIINDLDNLFPNVTWRFAKNFVEYLRDYVTEEDAAVCAIGHNLIGKVKRTSGYSGEIMYPIASTIYRVCERSKKDNAVTRVSCYKTFQQCPKDFAFVINEHNFPQQVTTEQQQTQEYVPQNSDNHLENTDLEQKRYLDVNNVLTFPPKKIFKKKLLLRNGKAPAHQRQHEKKRPGVKKKKQQLQSIESQ